MSMTLEAPIAEDRLPRRTKPYTASEYLESLRDGREGAALRCSAIFFVATPLVQHGGGVKMVPYSIRSEPPSVLALEPTVEVASTRRNSRHTLQWSEARSRGSVASTVGRVQRFKGSIAQARFQPCEPSYP